MSQPARRPLNVMFVKSIMPIGGAETLLVNLIQTIDRTRFSPSLCCLKSASPLGDDLGDDVPVYQNLLTSKYDMRILWRLVKLMKENEIDVVITVGAGDKMFWGRLAAKLARVPVVISALHSTGWPDGVGRLNRMLTRWTDAFIGVAKPHGQYMVENERFPKEKVHVIPNGVDTQRFTEVPNADTVRNELGIGPASPVIGIVAALRPEKNHQLLLRAVHKLRNRLPDVQLLLVGDGPCRTELEKLTGELQLDRHVHFLGSRSDIPAVLSAVNVFALCSHNEANPVSILEAMSIGRPVVATDVGSVAETVHPGKTGFLVPPGDVEKLEESLHILLQDPVLCGEMGAAARKFVEKYWSLSAMVRGYESLIEQLYLGKPTSSAEEPQMAPRSEALARS